MSNNANSSASGSSSNEAKPTQRDQVPYTVPYTGSSGELVDGTYVPSSSTPEAQVRKPTHGSMGGSNQPQNCHSRDHGPPTEPTNPGKPNYAAALGQEAEEQKSKDELEATKEPLRFAESRTAPKDADAGH
ncbi:hypothetical protein MKZ38_000292 [Zalerion maritima]|uniref:Uncharacterized protein n=1 Tax=Zalerion maritima TaxID=339359 RepID=A0AAD5RZK1_9PEZI|nr:hypothetical protein MKZ38_000292 [Zalerion maritima]